MILGSEAALAEQQNADVEEDEVGESSVAAATRKTRASARPAQEKKARRRRAEISDDEEPEEDEDGEEYGEEEDEDASEDLPPQRTRNTRSTRNSAKQEKLTRINVAETKVKRKEEESKKRKRKTKLVVGKDGKRTKKPEDWDSSGSEYEAPLPAPGQIAFCAECNCRFTVTPYSRAGPDGTSLLCNACGKKTAPIEAVEKKKRQVSRVNKKSNARALLDLDSTGVKSLQEMCIQLVAKHIGDVETLGYIGSYNMDKIAQIISKNRSLNNHTMKLFMEPAEHVLRFYDCSKIESDNLREIGAFVPTLRRLYLKFCGRMRDDCLDYYGEKLKQLDCFEIYGAFNVTEECYVRFFQNVGNRLTEFGVGDTSRFRLAAMNALVDNCPDLEVLRLRTLTNIDDECIRLLTGLSNLRVLEISDPGLELTDQPIIDVLNSCGSGLKELNLNGCTYLTDSTLEAIGECCGRLEILSLEELELLTDEGIAKLFTSWSTNIGLKELNLSRCSELKPEGFARVIRHSAESLERLNLNSCKDLDDDAWSFLSSFKLPMLEDIDVSFIRSVNDAIVEDIIRISPELKVVRAWGCHRLTEAVQLREDLHLVGREADILS
ncbi:hypothetical protein ABW19_dt0200840 [Dactylella cylindrospora]|nr:hypothetical protein ABW19_dt0200840 [Dactylella cylindrospora]